MLGIVIMYFVKILIWVSQQPDEVYITIPILEIKISVAQRACITYVWPVYLSCAKYLRFWNLKLTRVILNTYCWIIVLYCHHILVMILETPLSHSKSELYLIQGLPADLITTIFQSLFLFDLNIYLLFYPVWLLSLLPSFSQCSLLLNGFSDLDTLSFYCYFISASTFKVQVILHTSLWSFKIAQHTKSSLFLFWTVLSVIACTITLRLHTQVLLSVVWDDSREHFKFSKICLDTLSSTSHHSPASSISIFFFWRSKYLPLPNCWCTLPRLLLGLPR